MSQIILSTFEQAIARYFEPIAREHGWGLIRRSDTIYDISSPHFIMRIRFGVGMHSKNIDVVLTPANQEPEAITENASAFGVLAIAGYNGIEMQYMPKAQTEVGFLEYAQYVANMAKDLGVPYLIGERSNGDAVREYWRRKSEEELEIIKAYKYPPQVQKRWHLPPPSKATPDQK